MLALTDFIFYLTLYALLTIPLGFVFLHYLAWQPIHASSFLPMSAVSGTALLTAFLFITGHFIPIHFTHVALLSLLLTALCLVSNQKKTLKIRDSLGPLKDYAGLMGAVALLFLYLVVHYYQPANDPRYYNLMPDYIKHDGVLWALENKTLPPHNPFFHPGSDIPLSYYYLFHLLPAALPKIEGDSYQHLFAMTAIWTGIVFIFSVYVWLREKNWSLGKINYIILAFTLLGGLDVYASYHIVKNIFYTCQTNSLECWTNTGSDLEHMFAGLLGSLANAPQHVFSLAMALAVIPLYKKLNSSWIYFLWVPVVCVFGSSIYLGLALLIAGFTHVGLFHRHAIKLALEKKTTLSLFLSGAVLLILAMEIAPSPGSFNSGVSLKPFTLSPKIDFSWADRGITLVRVFMSMAPFLALMVIHGFRRSLQCFTQFENTVIFVLLVVSVFFSSNGPNNDLTMRVLFSAKLFFFIAALDVFFSATHRLVKKLILSVLILTGLVVTFNNFIYRGPYRLWAQSSSTQGSNDYLAAVDQIKSQCDPNNMLQGNISTYSHLLMLIHRKIFYLDDSHSTLFNVNALKHHHIRSETLLALRYPKSAKSFPVFKKYNIECLLLKKGTFSLEGNSPTKLIFENKKYAVFKIALGEVHVY